MKLHEEDMIFKKLIEHVETKMHPINAAKIEKDYWLTLFLKKLVAIQPEIVFKGGTSLSRCFAVMMRLTSMSFNRLN